MDSDAEDRYLLTANPMLLAVPPQLRPSRDFWSRSPTSYLGWSNAVGEAFAPCFPAVSRPLSLVTAAYVVMATVDRSRVASQFQIMRERRSLAASRTAIDTILTEWFACLTIPSLLMGATAPGVVRLLRERVPYFSIPSMPSVPATSGISGPASSLAAGGATAAASSGWLQPMLKRGGPGFIAAVTMTPIVMPISYWASNAIMDWAIRPLLNSQMMIETVEGDKLADTARKEESAAAGATASALAAAVSSAASSADASLSQQRGAPKTSPYEEEPNDLLPWLSNAPKSRGGGGKQGPTVGASTDLVLVGGGSDRGPRGNYVAPDPTELLSSKKPQTSPTANGGGKAPPPSAAASASTLELLDLFGAADMDPVEKERLAWAMDSNPNSVYPGMPRGGKGTPPPPSSNPSPPAVPSTKSAPSGAKPTNTLI